MNTKMLHELIKMAKEGNKFKAKPISARGSEGWFDKNKYGVKETYAKFRRRMLQMRMRSWALKDGFSDVLLGISIDEYDNVPSGFKNVRESGPSLSEKLEMTKVD